MFNGVLFAFLVIFAVISLLNYYYIRHPIPYPSREVRKNFERGRIDRDSFKFQGFSYYLLPKLAQSKEDWIKGRAYWHKAWTGFGVIGVVITVISFFLGKLFRLEVVSIYILLLYFILGGLSIFAKMEKEAAKN